MNTNQAFLEVNTEVDFDPQQPDFRPMTIDELSMVGGGQDTATLG